MPVGSVCRVSVMDGLTRVTRLLASVSTAGMTQQEKSVTSVHRHSLVTRHHIRVNVSMNT